MNILVLGSNGQVGKSIKRILQQRKEFTLNFLTRNDIDLNHIDLIKKKLIGYKPDIIINCSAYTAVDSAEDNSQLAFKINNTAVKIIAETSKEIDATFIHLSTDYVFDGNKKKPYSELDKTNPINVYGLSKLEGENAIHLSECKFIILRTSWVFSEFNKNFFKTILNLIHNGEDINIVNDQIGCPTYATEIARAIEKISLRIFQGHAYYGIFHFSGLHQTSWYDFGNYIYEKYKTYQDSHAKLMPVRTDFYPTKATRPLFSVLDNSKIYQKYSIRHPHWKDSVNEIFRNITPIDNKFFKNE